MKRTAAILLLAAASAAWSIPANAQRENRSIGENSIEAKKSSQAVPESGKESCEETTEANEEISEGAT